MKVRFEPFFCLCINMIGCAGIVPIYAQNSSIKQNFSAEVDTQTLNLFDKARNHSVPVKFYLPEKAGGKFKTN